MRKREKESRRIICEYNKNYQIFIYVSIATLLYFYNVQLHRTDETQEIYS